MTDAPETIWWNNAALPHSHTSTVPFAGGTEYRRADLPATDAQVLANEEVFMDETWSALKADATDLRKQQRILKAYRSATSGQNFSNEKVQALVEALEETQNDASFFQQSGISQTAMSAAFDRIHNRARAALEAMEE